MKINKILTIIIILVCLTGCTTTLKDNHNKQIIYKKTGQSITENILCKPKNPDIIKIYKDNQVDIKKLPACNEFKLTSSGYDGLWTTFFVKPLAWLILKIGTIIKNYGVSLIIVGILIRLILYPVTKSTALQSEKLKKANPELTAIEKKYKNKKDQADMMKKSQEIMAIYKKHKINPLTGCLFAFLQLPLFFAFLEAINRSPAIFESKLLFFQLGTTPYTALRNGQFQYLIIVVLLIVITYYSFKLNKTASINVEAQKQMDFMSKIMIVFISFAAFSLSTAIGIYWITSNIFTIVQNLLVKRSNKNESI